MGKWRCNFSIARDLLSESWPLILSSLAILIYYRIDQLMLGQMVGDAAVGLYSSATRVSEMPYFIATAITSSVTPGIFSEKRISEINYCQKIEKNDGNVSRHFYSYD
jgi:PST family polysaccharide transporter